MMPGDDVLLMPSARRIEVFTGTGQRRRWSAEAKVQIVAESYATSVGETSGFCQVNCVGAEGPCPVFEIRQRRSPPPMSDERRFGAGGGWVGGLSEAGG